MINNVQIENMDHLVYDYALSSKAGGHYSQADKNLVKLTLLFWIVDSELEDVPCKLVSIKAPAGLPVGRIRHFINYTESQLATVYDKVKRANIVLTSPQDSLKVSASFNLPVFEVAFI